MLLLNCVRMTEAKVVRVYHCPGPCASEQGGTRPLTRGPALCHIECMKKTTLDLSHIMAAYTERVKAEAKAAEAVREGRLPRPMPTTVWAISDRH